MRIARLRPSALALALTGLASGALLGFGVIAGGFAVTAPVARGEMKPCEAVSNDPAGAELNFPGVRIRGGSFLMGSDRNHPEERPQRPVSVGDFWIDTCEVTNAQFAAFVKATGYVTVAERPVDPAKYPGATPEQLKPGSIVFKRPDSVAGMADFRQWWALTPGASWKNPEGPASSLEGRWNHPVVHVTHEDAQAYARWLGRELPTEAEWEYAARGGLDGKEYTWGDEKSPSGVWQVNAWQGIFPISNQLTDGYEGTAPVSCYMPNGYGLFDMAGNVWELTADDYADQRGIQPAMKVVKGGSHLCADNFCYRYRPSARQPASTDTGASHIGFRTIKRMTRTQ